MKKTINIFVSIAMVFGVFLSAFIMSPIATEAVDASSNTEILYLSDSMVSNDGITRIYKVELDTGTLRANLTEILGSPIPLDQVDALAASADGRFLYAIDRDTSVLGSLNVETGIFSSIGPVINGPGGANIAGIVLAATDPSENLYVASQSTDEVYIVDKATGIATSEGKVFNGATSLNLSGADLVFATDGSMYIWTNAAKTNAPKGLYLVDDPLASPLTASHLGLGTGNIFTGLAIRDNGAGDLVGSDTTIDSIVEINKVNANMPKAYRMYLDGEEYAYAFGDMTSGPIISPLHINKTVNVSYDRYWEWDVVKTSTTTSLTLEAGATSTVSYDVTVTATSTDSDWTVYGEITIHNPNIMEAAIIDVIDMMGTTTASTTCLVDESPITFPYDLESEETMTCLYEAVIPAGNTLNIATVETESEGVVPGNSVEENVIAGLPTNEIDETANLNDDKYGVINGILVATTTPLYFDYSLLVGPYAESGDYEFENIVIVTAVDTSATSSDNHIITINVPVIETACTLTQGYWKTHSSYGPAPYDAIWDGLESEMFYLSGQTYYKVLWTAPKGGNAYYQLAHQYIAAELNVLNGASVPTEVSEAMIDAKTLFENNTPNDIAKLKGNNSLRKDFLELASVLGSYNEGSIGPGHCE